ncbi:MAG: HNH endonuclease [Actinomycetota bacterium]|nr:HNH endonuclease [Actinomycetota bacterium]
MQTGLLDALRDAETALHTASTCPVTDLIDDELHEVMRLADRLRRQAEVTEVTALGEIDLRRSCEPLGAKSTALFAAWQLHLADGLARSMVRTSRELRRVPAGADAYRAGLITRDHIRLLAKCQTTNPDAFTEAEEMLVGLAVSMDFVDFTKAITYWCQLADPDGSQNDAEAKLAARNATVVTAPDAMVLIKAQLDPIGGGIFLSTFEQITRELFLQDWEAAKAIHGDDISLDKLARTNTQRAADALQVMAERARMVNGNTSDIHGPKPLITVLVGEDTLRNLCETEAGTILDPHDLLRLLHRAEIERIIFHGRSRVLDVGERHRFFTGPTRRAIQVRDRECDADSCHEPVTNADIDHILEYSNDGLTVQANGRVLCKWHHRWRHKHDRPTPPAA